MADLHLQVRPGTDAFLLAARKEKLAADFYDDWAGLYPPGPERELLRSLAKTEAG